MNKLPGRWTIGGILATGARVLALNETSKANTESFPFAFQGNHHAKTIGKMSIDV